VHAVQVARAVIVAVNVDEAVECLLMLPEGETTRGSVATYYSQSCIRFALNCVYGDCFALGWEENMRLRESFAKNDVYLEE